MTTTIDLLQDHLRQLDISPVGDFLEQLLKEDRFLEFEQAITFNIDFPREQSDPRELSEIP